MISYSQTVQLSNLREQCCLWAITFQIFFPIFELINTLKTLYQELLNSYLLLLYVLYIYLVIAGLLSY